MTAERSAAPERGNALRTTGLAGILLVACVRALVHVHPQVLFDVDPARDPLPMIAIGPVGSGVLDIVLLVASALALLGEWRSGRGLRALPIALAALGAVAVLLHGASNSVDAFRGGTWVAAAFAFAALAHLVRERRLRAVALGVLLAVAVPLAARGATQVTSEHAATVALYEQQREMFLADRGWESDSSAARSYERRLRQPEATGWFTLSNPFSSIMGAGFVGLGALAIFGWRRGLSGPSSAVLVAALGASILLFVNGGKGAIAATALASVCALLMAKGRVIPRGGLAMALAATAVLLVIARGFMGPTIGELSVLFRSFYFEAAARIVTANPLLGVGADAVQPAFMLAKPAHCPEDVTSMHSMFVDWLVAFGAFGAAWAVMVATCLRGQLPCHDAKEAREPDSIDALAASPLALRIAGAIAVAALVVQAQVEAPVLDESTLVVRAVALAGFVLVAACSARIAEELSARELAVASLSVALLVLVHAQIELMVWLAGSTVLALALIAIGTALPTGGSRGRPSLAVAFLPLVVVPFVLASVLRERSLGGELERAASVVRPLADVRAAFQQVAAARARGEADGGGALLDAVAAADANNDEVARVADALRANDAEAVRGELIALDGRLRRAAAAMLVDAANTHRFSRVPREAAIKQLAASGRRATGTRAAQTVDLEAFADAQRLAAEWVAETGSQRAISLSADLAMEALHDVRARGDGEAIARAAQEASDWAARALALQPWSARRGVDLADALMAANRFDEAARAYEAALAQDDRLSLDPLMQFSTRERDRVKTALARATSRGAEP